MHLIMTTDAELIRDYETSLSELTFNSKPHINVLTLLADENRSCAQQIVDLIEDHILKTESAKKLPLLYLVDSILKNCKDSPYRECFAKNIITIFVHIFTKGDEKTRQSLFKLRNTWSSVFATSKLCAIDIKVHAIDAAWPLSEPARPSGRQGSPSASPVKPVTTSIHVNPKFLTNKADPTSLIQPLIQQAKPTPALSEDPRHRALQELQEHKVRLNAQRCGEPSAKTVGGKDGGASARLPAMVRPVNSALIAALKSVPKDPRTVQPLPKPSFSTQSSERPVVRSASSDRVSAVASKPVFIPSDNHSMSRSASTYVKSNTDGGNKTVSPKPVTSYSSTSRTPDVKPKSADLDQRQVLPVIPKKARSSTVPPEPKKTGMDGRPGGTWRHFGEETFKQRIAHQPKQCRLDEHEQANVKPAKGARESPTRSEHRTVRPPASPKVGTAPMVSRQISTASRASNSRARKVTPEDLALRPAVAASPRKRPVPADSNLDDDTSDDEVVAITARTKPPMAPTSATSRSAHKPPTMESVASATPAHKERNKEPTKKKPRSPFVEDPSISTSNDARHEDGAVKFLKSVPARVKSKRVSKPLSSPAGVTSKSPVSKNGASSELQRSANPVVDIEDRFWKTEHGDIDLRYPSVRMPPPSLMATPVPLSPQMLPLKKRKLETNDRDPEGSTPKSAPASAEAVGAARSNTYSYVGTMSTRGPATATASPSNATKSPSGKAEVIPPNNVIFVEGQAHLVTYVRDEAVIRRNGRIHRINFHGGGRDVIIDGIACHLLFGQTREVFIDGHPHKIRFGGPSRELYMGGHPFRGSFGGPPIHATINGVRHKMQLSGPSPEVKIDPEPAYDLMKVEQDQWQSTDSAGSKRHAALLEEPPLSAITPGAMVALAPAAVYKPIDPRLASAATAGQQPQPHAELSMLGASTVATPQPVDMGHLLNKLVLTGIIGGAATPAPVNPPVVNKTVLEIETAIPTLDEPTAALQTFEMKGLRVRYTAVVGALYKESRLMCSNCGMRFSETDQQKYSKHLDWHFKQNRIDKMPSRQSWRNWYIASEDWINYEEFGDEKHHKIKSAVFEKQKEESCGKKKGLVTSTNSVIVALQPEHNECSVCQEAFEQFWDEEEEVWKLKNATLVEEKAYHPLCYQDKTHNDTAIIDSTLSESPTKSIVNADDVSIAER